MKRGIASIHRNRSKWIVGWPAFHMVVGFEQFYLYAHKTKDGMTEKLLKLARRYAITRPVARVSASSLRSLRKASAPWR